MHQRAPGRAARGKWDHGRTRNVPRDSGRARHRRLARSPRARRWVPMCARGQCCGEPPSRGHPSAFWPCGRRLGQVHDHRVQRLDTLGQIARLGRPVIHLGVDVDGVLAAPRRAHAGIPQALQRRRLSAWSRAAQQEVTAELKVESYELRVVAACEPPDPLVGRPPLGLAVAHVECDPPEHALMLGHVSLLEGLVRFRGRRGKARQARPLAGRHLCRRIACNLLRRQ